VAERRYVEDFASIGRLADFIAGHTLPAE